MRPALPLLALALAAALSVGPARAAAPDGLEARRAEVVRLDGRRAELATRRRALEADLDRLAAEIADLKARRADGAPLFGDPELDRRLKASKDLSDRLDALAREEERVGGALEAAARALLGAYDARVTEARRRLESAEGDAGRRAALEDLGRLEAARREVQAGLDRLAPQTAHRAIPAAPATDDPEELWAQADRLRDSRDRLARRLAELERRVGEARDQQALEREMQGFLSETRLFDETDRASSRVAVTQVGGDGAADAPAESPPQSGASDGYADPNRDAPSGGAGPATPGAGEPTDAVGAVPPTAESGGSTGDVLFRLERTPSRAEASAAIDALLRADDDASLEVLEDRVEEIRGLIDRLDRRADEIERRADALER